MLVLNAIIHHYIPVILSVAWAAIHRLRTAVRRLVVSWRLHLGGVAVVLLTKVNTVVVVMSGTVVVVRAVVLLAEAFGMLVVRVMEVVRHFSVSR